MTDTKAVSEWYDANAENEHDRLQHFGLEYALSLRAINQCIASIQSQQQPPRPLKILDLGGGTGRYSIALASQSHLVTYTDLSPASLSLGIRHAATQNIHLAHTEVVDALQVETHPSIFRQGHYDIVLCMGPLYHLLEASEREQVVASCAKMVCPGGYVCIAFVTRWAHLKDVARRDPGRVGRERGFYEDYTSDGAGERVGRYDRVDGRSGWHVGSGREAWELVERGGGGLLEVERVVGCEGFLGGGLSEGLEGDGESGFEIWVETCAAVAEREEMWGASDHLLVVAKRR